MVDPGAHFLRRERTAAEEEWRDDDVNGRSRRHDDLARIGRIRNRGRHHETRRDLGERGVRVVVLERDLGQVPQA